MTIYKINIDHRNYVKWNICNVNTLEPSSIEGTSFVPASHKLFTGDIFIYNKNKVEIQHSAIRTNENIPAVLILADNKTYGREIKSNKRGKLLYKCVPDDTRIPIFLVPYEIKQMGFSKAFTNIYVTIRYKSWDDKHPCANISQIIGPVDVLDNFYEYQLYCKSLNASMQKFNKSTNQALSQYTNQEKDDHDVFIHSIYSKYKNIEDRTSWKVFTIDPPSSLDFDDGFSIKKLNHNQTLLSIYIANVSILMDSLNLWSSFSQRISTIYLPDRKRPMLPTILSDCLCSLQQNKPRFSFVMDILLDQDCNIVQLNYANSLIKVTRNYGYEDTSLIEDIDYNYLLTITRKMAPKYPYIHTIRNSHDVVSYLMIFMNYHCAQDLLTYNNGIFRSTLLNNKIKLPDELPDDVTQFIKIWNSSTGQYTDISVVSNEDKVRFTRHELLEMDAYIHMTSPIRRLVDLLNMIQFQINHGLIHLSTNATDFYSFWINQMEYINVTMRSIRKVQNDCNLLYLCHNNPSTLDKLYDGYCFDKIVKNDGVYQYIVFLPELRLASRITMRENLTNYEKRQYKLFLFNNEEKFKKKIRLQII